MFSMADTKKDDTRSLLNDVPLLKDLSPEQLDWIAQRSHRKLFPAGANIFTIEQPAEVVYIILFGTVKVHVEQGDGRDVVLSILGSGDTLGEMSLIDSVGRSASALTLEDTLMLWMDNATFQKILDEFPSVARNLVRILTARIRLSDQLIQAFATLDVDGRVARQLLAFAEKYGLKSANAEVRIPIMLTQGDIADLVGASRKRVNQVMVAFKQQELIDVDEKGYIVVKDRSGLERYCG